MSVGSCSWSTCNASADPLHRYGFAAKWASTTACCRSSASSSSATRAIDRALLPGDAAASARGGRRRRLSGALARHEPPRLLCGPGLGCERSRAPRVVEG
eukprot:5178705-Prymnesium_polylepis.1